VTTPLHSVIMPVLNGVKYVREGICSALAELGTDDELIVIDNGSDDGTPELVRAVDDPRIRLLNETKRGPAAARNRGMREVRGKYVSFHDYDDLWPPGRLAALVSHIKGTPGTNAAYGRIELRFEDGIDSKYLQLDGRAMSTFGVIVYLVTADLMRHAGPMDESLMLGEDTDYVLKLRAAGMSAVECDAVVAIYRRHQSNITLDGVGVMRDRLGVLARNIARRRAEEQPK
jgi:glycosyltransferase involved in cell wall biosynthesis